MTAVMSFEVGLSSKPTTVEHNSDHSIVTVPIRPAVFCQIMFTDAAYAERVAAAFNSTTKPEKDQTR